MRFLYRALRWLELGTQNPQKLTVGAYPCVLAFLEGPEHKKTRNLLKAEEKKAAQQNTGL